MHSEEQDSRKKTGKMKNHTRDEHSYFQIVAISHINIYWGFLILLRSYFDDHMFKGLSAVSRG